MKLIIKNDGPYRTDVECHWPIGDEDRVIIAEMIAMFDLKKSLPLKDAHSQMLVRFRVDGKDLILYTDKDPEDLTPKQLRELFSDARDLLWKDLDNYKLFAKFSKIHKKLNKKESKNGTGTDSNTNKE